MDLSLHIRIPRRIRHQHAIWTQAARAGGIECWVLRRMEEGEKKKPFHKLQLQRSPNSIMYNTNTLHTALHCRTSLRTRRAQALAQRSSGGMTCALCHARAKWCIYPAAGKSAKLATSVAVIGLASGQTLLERVPVRRLKKKLRRDTFAEEFLTYRELFRILLESLPGKGEEPPPYAYHLIQEGRCAPVDGDASVISTQTRAHADMYLVLKASPRPATCTLRELAACEQCAPAIARVHNIDTSGKARWAHTACGICRNPAWKPELVLPCGHEVHLRCWQQREYRQRAKAGCPDCHRVAMGGNHAGIMLDGTPAAEACRCNTIDRPAGCPCRYSWIYAGWQCPA